MTKTYTEKDIRVLKGLEGLEWITTEDFEPRYGRVRANGVQPYIWSRNKKRIARCLYEQHNYSVRALAEVFKLPTHSTAYMLICAQRWVRTKKEWVKAKEKWQPVIDLRKQKSRIYKWYLDCKWPAWKISKKLCADTERVVSFLRKWKILRTEKERSKIIGYTKSMQTLKNNIRRDPNKLTWFQYRALCTRITYAMLLRERRQDKENAIIDPDNKYKLHSGYQIDHKVSRSECYINKLPLHIANHPVNLRVITSEKNMQKGEKSCHSINHLLFRIKSYNKKFGNPFADVLKAA